MRIPLKIPHPPVGFRAPERRHRAAVRRTEARAPGRRRTRTATLYFHPSWGNHAEELLYHTSRYYAYTEDFLRRIGGIRNFSFGTFQAQRLDPDGQDAMARLLRRPASRTTARAVIALIHRLQGSGKRPLHRRPRRRTGTFHDATGVPARHGTTGMPAADPLLNLADRFGLPVRSNGKHLWVSFTALRPLLDASNPTLRQAFHDAIEQLHEGGYHLHDARHRR